MTGDDATGVDASSPVTPHHLPWPGAGPGVWTYGGTEAAPQSD